MKQSDYKTLPETPGVYLMKDADGAILYVGKAGNLRRRVSSYFERPHDVRIEALVRKIKKIDYQRADTALEALILEAELIKKLTPPFNVREKDDKSFLYVEITKEKFPRVTLVRGNKSGNGKLFGPFTSASSLRDALKILRRIFPWNIHPPNFFSEKKLGGQARPCFDYEIGLCPGTCIGAITREDYLKNIGRLELFLEGKKKQVVRSIEKEMTSASKALDFEWAEKLRRQLFALKHIRDTALITDQNFQFPISNFQTYRIEGYDISNISGTSAVGSMVVFENGEPNKAEYRKFKIKTVFEPNDVGMITEILERRLKHLVTSDKGQVTRDKEVPNINNKKDHVPYHLSHVARQWPLPNLILVDGGLAQANAVKKVLMRAGLKIPIVGIVKGPERKRNDIIGAIPKGVNKATLVRVRDEAHRFAISYHRKLRGVKSLLE
jgi:excinuclease ABC subunit C